MHNNFKLLLIIVLALFIRVYHHHHILMSDEANNMLTIKALIEGDGFREYFFKHPPLFIILASLISYPYGDSFHPVQGVSIAFSTLSMIPLYLIASKMFDKRTAFVSLLILAVMPLNIVYSTWVKQDAMLMFFFLWSLYFYISQRPYASGALFGIALLTKEFALFLLPIILGWEASRGWGKDALKRGTVWLIVGAAISWWWYAFFGGKSFEVVGNVATGGSLFEYPWHYPWHYYMSNLPTDVTAVMLPFFAIGIFMGRGNVPVALIWVLAFYIPLSLMTQKAPWWVYLSSPGIAILIAIGFLRVWDSIRFALLKWGMAAVIAVSASITLYMMDSTEFYERQLGRKLPAFNDEAYLRDGRYILKGEGKAAFLEYNPTLQYYLGIPDKRLYYLGSNLIATNRESLRGLAEKNGIDWFVIDRNSVNYLERNLADISDLWGEPALVGSVLIYKVSTPVPTADMH